MPYTRNDFTLNPTVTQTTLYDSIKARFLAMGDFRLFSEFSATTDRIMIFELILDSTRLAGKVYLRIRVTTALAITQQIFTFWNLTNNTGIAPSTESALITFVPNIAIEMISFVKAPEYRFLLLSQSTVIAFLGILRPDNKPSSWSEDSYPYCFISNNAFDAANQFRNWLACTSNPYSNTSAFTSNMADPRLSNPNPIDNRRDSEAGIRIYSTNQGIAGQSSGEIISVAALGQARFELITMSPSTEEYVLLNPGYGSMALMRRS